MKTSRRNFIKNAGLASTAIILGVYACQSEPEGEIILFKTNVDDLPEGTPLNAFIYIETDGTIKIMSHRPDMGQGTHQAIPLIIAEELDVSLDQVQIVHAPADKRLGRQSVGGSSTIRTSFTPMRKVGAAAREMLIGAAAKIWTIDPSQCRTENGYVLNPKSGEKLSYGDLVTEASQLDVPEDPKLKSVKEFKWIGKSVPRPAVPLKSSGRAYQVL